MTIMLRDRPDGQVEVILNRPEVIGVMRDHDLAAQFIAFLTERDPELKLAGDAVPLHEVAESLDDIAAAADAADGVALKSAPVAQAQRKAPKVQLPAVLALPSPPARRLPERLKLTEGQREAAFGRLGGGEPIASVAPDFGLSPAQLRGAWGHHCKVLQRHLAEGGQVPCKLCTKAFTPSISHPETCARCSHD